MTAPRPILPGRTYLVTRRCTQRQFLLRPDRETERIFVYCLAEAAARFELEIIAWTAMSNHYHAVVHDPSARLPAFLGHFHRLVAKVLNARWHRRENLWSTEQTSVVELLDDRDVLEKVLYVLCNPLHDDLVERVSRWPGASSLGRMGRSITVRRPTQFFRERGSMPPIVSLRPAVPPSWRGRAPAWRSSVRSAVRRREAAHRRRRAMDGSVAAHVVSMRAVSPLRRGRSSEPDRSRVRTHSSTDGLARRSNGRARRAFLAAYAAALARLMDGDRGVVFPAGTYQLRYFTASACPSLTEPRRHSASWASAHQGVAK